MHYAVVVDELYCSRQDKWCAAKCNLCWLSFNSFIHESCCRLSRWTTSSRCKPARIQHWMLCSRPGIFTRCQ